MCNVQFQTGKQKIDLKLRTPFHAIQTSGELNRKEYATKRMKTQTDVTQLTTDTQSLSDTHTINYK